MSRWAPPDPEDLLTRAQVSPVPAPGRGWRSIRCGEVSAADGQIVHA